MGEVGNTIRLLTILQSKGQAKGDYLADRIEVSKRQIYRYIGQLQKSGIDIKSKRGRYGGFYLDRNQFLNFNSINKEDIELMELACQNLKGTNFPHTKEIKNIIEKLKSSTSLPYSQYSSNIKSTDYYIVKENSSNVNTTYAKKLFDDMRASINTREKIRILYKSNSSGESYRNVHPYGIFSNQGEMYLVAYCEKRKDIRSFKTNRIIDYEILEEKRYKIKENFSMKEYTDLSFGVFKDKKIYFKLKITHPFSTIIKEREHIKNEKIVEVDENTITYEAEAMGKTEIISWIISMKTYCEVLEPKNFRKEVKEILQNMLRIYE